MTQSEIIAWIVAIAGAIGTIYNAVATRKKTNDDGANAISDAVVTLITPLKNELTELRAKVAEQGETIRHLSSENKSYQLRIAELTSGCMLLTAQLNSHNIKPMYSMAQDSGTETQ